MVELKRESELRLECPASGFGSDLAEVVVEAVVGWGSGIG